ncbi:hypothetical protein Tco_1184394 [Tanacetum coccineum]
MTHRSCLRWKPTGKIFKTVGLRWVPTGKIFTSSTTKVDSEPQNGSNADITNQYECAQTLDVSAGTSNLSAGLAPPRQMTSDHNSSELGIHDHSNELSRSKLVPKVVPPADKTATSRQELELLFHHHITMLSSQAVNKSPTHYPCDSARTFRVILFSIHNDEWKSFQCHHQTALRRPYALSWKPCQGDSLNLPDHRIHKDGDGDASFQLKSDSLPHAHAQTTKTFYKHQDSRIMKAQELKTKTSAQTLIYKIFLQRYQVYQGRLLASFQDDAKYEHVGQDTRSQVDQIFAKHTVEPAGRFCSLNGTGLLSNRTASLNEFSKKEEDDEEDPADYPADRGDDRDDEEPSNDDDDDDAEEEEHLAPADPAAVAYSADQDPYLAYRVVLGSLRPRQPARSSPRKC